MKHFLILFTFFISQLAFSATSILLESPRFGRSEFYSVGLSDSGTLSASLRNAKINLPLMTISEINSEKLFSIVDQIWNGKLAKPNQSICKRRPPSEYLKMTITKNRKFRVLLFADCTAMNEVKFVDASDQALAESIVEMLETIALEQKSIKDILQ